MKISSKILIVLLVIVTLISAVALVGCNAGQKMANKMYADYTDIASSSTFYDGAKTMHSFKIEGKSPEKKGITIDLGKETQFNTVALCEETKTVTMFNIFASNKNEDKDYVLIYSGDTIEGYRTCFVGNVNYRYLRIEVAESKGKYKVNDVKIYNNKNEKTSKRVASYFLLDRVDSTDLTALDTVTDIVLFSWMRFDKDGFVKILIEDPNGKNGELLEESKAKEMYGANLAKLREAVNKIETAQNRHINIFPTILMPSVPSGEPDANLYARAIMADDKVQNTANNVKAFIDEWDFDGVDFDYEYPYKREEHKLFDNFLITVDKTIGKDKILSTALGAWNIKMSKEAIAVLDQVQLMTYDMFDSHGYHSAFNSCMISDLNKAISKGIPVEKINLGLPFYSRPLSRGGYWGDYFRFYNEGYINSKYDNRVNYYPKGIGFPLYEPEYFNGYQMVQDKTAFAIDSDVKGVMIWHMNCDIKYDNELSLFRAIHETFVAKDANLVKNTK